MYYHRNYDFAIVIERNDKIVHPDWILDSINAQKILNIDQYRLYSERPISQFMFSSKSPPDPSLDKNRPKFKMKTAISPLEFNTSVERPSLENLGKISKPPSFSTVISTVKAIELPGKALKSTDQGFMASYYQNSRLHYLSTWRTDFQYQLTEFLSTFSTRIQDETIYESNRTIVHVDMVLFQLEDST
jgi:hypothetical protein